MSVWHLYLLVISLTGVSFGGGQVLLAGLERELVRPGFISPSEFAAGVALGQSTPGPLAAFTTAVGRYVLGVPGAIAATAGLITVSLVAVMLISRMPQAWFKLPAVRGGLAAVTPFAVAMALYLALRVLAAGSLDRWEAPVVILVGVAVGRLMKAPAWALIGGGLVLGMLVQGTALAGW